MDIQRTLLIGAIMLLSFMLLTEWVNFKAGKEAPVEASQRLTAADNGGAEGPVAQEVPSATSATEIPVASTAAEDVPVVADLESDTSPVVTASGNIIQVYTDTLQVAIDLNGGDIVEVALPKFLEALDQPDVPFVLLENNAQRVYVAQSGLIGPNGIDAKGRADYTAAQTRYDMGNADELNVELTWTGNGDVTVSKVFRFTRDSYVISVDFEVENNGQERWTANLFGQIKRDSTAAPQGSTSSMGMQPFLGAATTTPDDRFLKFSFEDMREEPFKAQLDGGWIAMIQHYFLSAWIPSPDRAHNYSTRVTNAGFNIAGFTSPSFSVDPGSQRSIGARFYAGPKDQYSLQKISPYLELSVDYGWLWWIGTPLFWLLTKIQSLVGNWGAAIILLTVLIKAAFFKLSATSYRSMANMRRVQPKLQDIREQYADDKQKQSQAMMDLYRKEKINPMGGCLPILVQMPVFIALYWVLMESVELRHAPFMLWIDDLSVMDPYFVLPLMMGASMWFMQKLNPPPPDPMQAKIMQWLPIVFTFFFLWFPAGLVLYWVVNNLLSMAQQYVITRQIEKAGA